MHTQKIALLDVSFAVQQAGRQKVLEEKQKNVHAFVRGNYAGKDFNDFYDCNTLATYNPYKFNSFVEKDGETPVYTASKAFLTTKPGMAVPRMLIKRD